MAPPRFQILLGVSASWVPVAYRGRSRALLADPAAWRLLGSNNRECCRSPVVFSDAPACLGAVVTMLEGLETYDTGLVADLGSGLWTWRIGTEQDPIAVSPRSYHRRREGQRSLEVALANIPGARMPPEVVRMRRRTRPEDRRAVGAASGQLISLRDGQAVAIGAGDERDVPVQT